MNYNKSPHPLKVRYNKNNDRFYFEEYDHGWGCVSSNSRDRVVFENIIKKVVWLENMALFV